MSTEPSLLSLPTELHPQILSYLSQLDPEDAEPSLIILRRTHRSFRALIPFAPYGPAVPHVSHLSYARWNNLLRTERQHPYLIPAGMLPCYECMVVLEVERFEGLGREGQVVGTRMCKRCWKEVYEDVIGGEIRWSSWEAGG